MKTRELMAISCSSSFAWMILVSSAIADDPEPIARRIQPILTRCMECHHSEEPSGGLDMTSREFNLARRRVGGLVPAQGCCQEPDLSQGRGRQDAAQASARRRASRAGPRVDRCRGTVGRIALVATEVGRAGGTLGTPAAGTARAAGGPVGVMGGESDRCVRHGASRSGRALAGSARGPDHLDPPRHFRPAGSSSGTRGGREFSRRSLPGRVRAFDRPPAVLAPLWREVGPALAGRGAILREPRLRVRPHPRQRLALSRLRDPEPQ